MPKLEEILKEPAFNSYEKMADEFDEVIKYNLEHYGESQDIGEILDDSIGDIVFKYDLHEVVAKSLYVGFEFQILNGWS